MENTLWDVVTSPGKTERMTLDQLDASFQAGAISEGTLVREPGTSDWRPLYEIAGLEPPAAPAAANGTVAPSPSAAPEPVNVTPPVQVTPAVAAAPVELASLKSTINGAGFVHPSGPANVASLPNTFSNGASTSRTADTKGVEAGGPFAPSPSMTAPPSTETPSVRVPPPSKVPQVQASNPAEKPSLPARSSRTAPKTTKPPVTAPRRTGPPTSRTARGVPLPSVVPKDDLALPTGPAPRAGQPTGASPAATATTSDTVQNPKPLTPPKTGARRVSAPPAAVSATNGSRTRRAPPSILSATAPTAGLTPPPPPPAPVSPRSVPPPPSGMSLTHGHHPNPELAPWDVGGGGSHPPVPFNDNPLVGTPTPEQFAAPPPAVQVLPVPVAITPPEEPIPLSEPSGQKRLNAPPLPANAFAHLAPDPQPIAPHFQPEFVAPLQPTPPLHAAPAVIPNPAFAPAAAVNPASLYNALGFSNPPQEATPFAVDSNPFAVRPVAAPTRSGGVSWAEVSVLALAALLSAFVVLQRNGLMREWFGPNPQSAYARLETTLFGQPDIDTVAGVKALLKELSTEAGRSASSIRKPTSGSHATPKTDE